MSNATLTSFDPNSISYLPPVQNLTEKETICFYETEKMRPEQEKNKIPISCVVIKQGTVTTFRIPKKCCPKMTQDPFEN